MYELHMGVPEMAEYWQSLTRRVKEGSSDRDEIDLYRKIGKAMRLLSQNPRHPGLRTHDVEALTRRYGDKVWESYLENRNSRAARVFWVYGPGRKDITIVGIEPHPNDKSNSYQKITLSYAQPSEP